MPLRKVEKAQVGAVGYDSIQSVTSPIQAKALYDSGIRFAVRYLGGVTNAEVDNLTFNGIAVMPVTYSRKPGWLPTEQLGRDDGAKAAIMSKALGLPADTTVWCDLEGPGGHSEDVIDYVNAFSAELIKAGYMPGLYVGYETKLTSQELYALKAVRYWHSLSRVTDSSGALAEPNCGWCMYQMAPSVNRCGVWVDVDIIREDYMGRVPNWVVKA